MVEVCDLCRRCDHSLTECDVCGRKYCMVCHAICVGCVIGVNICKECEKRDDVRGIIDRAAAKLSPIVGRRDGALKRLGTLRRKKKRKAGRRK